MQRPRASAPGSPRSLLGKAALDADRPVVLEAVTDPNVPPLPPHVKFEQAKHVMFSLGKGDSDTPGIVGKSLRDKLQELFARAD